MTPTHLFTVEAAGGFRTGRGEDDPGRGVLFHSDTLMAALRSTAEETGLAGELFGGFPPAFTVSSVFAEVGGIRLYPAPLELRPSGAGEALRAPDKMSSEPICERRRADCAKRGRGDLAEPIVEAERQSRRPPPPQSGQKFILLGALGEASGPLELVSEGRLASLAEGRRVRLDPEDIVEGRLWGMPSERSIAGLPGQAGSMRILVDRAGGGVSRFARRRTLLPSGGRAFFLARLESPSLLGPLRELATRLGEAGLGGGRSIGMGQFNLLSAHPAPAFLWEDGGEGIPLLLLSLYLPAREEAERGVLSGAAAGLKLRGGWIHSGGPTLFRKRAVRMVVEGTVIAAEAGRIAGEVRDVTPPGFDRHKVWRDGRPFAIPYRALGDRALQDGGLS